MFGYSFHDEHSLVILSFIVSSLTQLKRSAPRRNVSLILFFSELLVARNSYLARSFISNTSHHTFRLMPPPNPRAAGPKGKGRGRGLPERHAPTPGSLSNRTPSTAGSLPLQTEAVATSGPAQPSHSAGGRFPVGKVPVHGHAASEASRTKPVLILIRHAESEVWVAPVVDDVLAAAWSDTFARNAELKKNVIDRKKDWDLMIDPELSSHGESQAKKIFATNPGLKDRLKRALRDGNLYIISSPLSRALDTTYHGILHELRNEMGAAANVPLHIWPNV